MKRTTARFWMEVLQTAAAIGAFLVVRKATDAGRLAGDYRRDAQGELVYDAQGNAIWDPGAVWSPQVAGRDPTPFGGTAAGPQAGPYDHPDFLEYQWDPKTQTFGDVVRPGPWSVGRTWDEVQRIVANTYGPVRTPEGKAARLVPRGSSSALVVVLVVVLLVLFLGSQ